MFVQRLMQRTAWLIWPWVADPFKEIAGILAFVLAFFAGWRSMEQLVCLRFVPVGVEGILVSGTDFCFILSTVTVFCLITGLVDPLDCP